jgi:hypothetical protein
MEEKPDKVMSDQLKFYNQFILLMKTLDWVGDERIILKSNNGG